MSIRRTATAIIMIATLLLALAAPAGAATETTSRGTAATSSVPLEVTVGDLTTRLGEVALMATTDTDTEERAPWSSVGLTLADIGGTAFGEVSVSSDGTTTNPGQTVGEDTALGEVGATVANLLAIADDTAGSATAAVTSLSTSAELLDSDAIAASDELAPLGLTATVTDVVSSVDATGAAATHTLAVAEVDLGLAHLLGSVLSTLPLQDLLALADLLELDTTLTDPLADVTGLVGATEDLVTAVADAVAGSEAIVAAADVLATADGGELDDLTTLLATLEGLDPIEVGTLAADITALLDIIDNDATYGGLGCTVDTITLASSVLEVQTTLDQMIACVEAAIDAATAALADELAALQTAVTNYLDALTAVADAITAAEAAETALDVTDIIAEIEALIDALLNADLAALGPIEVTQQVRAIGDSLDGSSASHTCRATTIQALTQEAVEILDCDGGDVLAPVVDTITATLGGVLDLVNGVDAGDVSLELFGTVEDTVSETDDGYVRATSVMEVLRLTIPAISVDACAVTDDLVCGLGIDLDDTLATVLGGLATQLTAAQAAADTALSTISGLLTTLGAGDLVTDVSGATVPDVTTIVTDLQTALDTLLTAVTDLALGTASGDLPAVSIVVDPQLEAEHQVTTATVDDPAPADPAPADPADPTLPNTGGGAALFAVLAIGAGAWLWRTRRREA